MTWGQRARWACDRRVRRLAESRFGTLKYTESSHQHAFCFYLRPLDNESSYSTPGEGFQSCSPPLRSSPPTNKIQNLRCPPLLIRGLLRSPLRRGDGRSSPCGPRCGAGDGRETRKGMTTENAGERGGGARGHEFGEGILLSWWFVSGFEGFIYTCP